MQARLLLQPFSREKRVGIALADRARTATALWLLSAWAQESGIKHLVPVVNEVRSRGGVAEAILGVDQGIATAEGLTLALSTFDRVYLFHDGSRTFHPKLYAIENQRQARLIIGSSNVTEGGLFDNFEASVELDLDRTSSEDEKLRSQARTYYDTFLGKGMPFRELDAALIAELRKEGVIATARERGRQESNRRSKEAPPLRRIFGGRVPGLPTAPPVPVPPARPATTSGRSGTGRTAVAAPAPVPSARSVARLPASSVVMSWWRELSASDAMKKDPGSHQRKDVILNRGPHPIDQTKFFRQYFFQGVPWSRQMMRSYRGRPPRPKEVAIVPFDVTLGVRHLGVHNIHVDHADSRVAGQGNSPTWLNWSSLGDEIAKGNYEGWYLLLERLANNSFRLTVQRSNPGQAVIPAYARV